MKRIILAWCMLLSVTACNKLKEETGENRALKVMTEGQWSVTKFTRDGNDVTAGFAPYKFQFRSNNTVEAINNASIEKTGTWQADPMGRSITSQFTNANATLTLLNGTWKITNSGLTFVEATQPINGELRTLRLDK